MQLCENCYMDLKNDGIEGCPGCAHIEYENTLREKIKKNRDDFLLQIVPVPLSADQPQNRPLPKHSLIIH